MVLRGNIDFPCDVIHLCELQHSLMLNDGDKTESGYNRGNGYDNQ